jgi:hypothetical protein
LLGPLWEKHLDFQTVGGPKSPVFAYVRKGQPALRVDLFDAPPYIKYTTFLVYVRDLEVAAADLRTALLGQLRRLADEQARALGPDHPDTLAARRSLASVLSHGSSSA